ncbi:MAG: HPF/RaiA family ribosome-associated protein [Betaproteobacteria bacterium]
MTYPITVRFLHMAASSALEQALHDKAVKLGQVHPALTGCNITVEPVGLHHHQGREFNVRLDLHMKGKDLAITKAAAEDPYVAAREAFEAARRALDADIDVRRGFVKQSAS